MLLSTNSYHKLSGDYVQWSSACERARDTICSHMQLNAFNNHHLCPHINSDMHWLPLERLAFYTAVLLVHVNMHLPSDIA